MPPPNVLRTRQAAEYLGIASSTLEKYRCYNQGPPFVKIGSRVVYKVAELDAWMAARRFTTTEPYRKDPAA